MTTIYIHTLNDSPAVFDGERVCFANFYGPPNKPATSLRQIRREQQVSIDDDAARCVQGEWLYGYRRYRV
jgi:hypothetical protein